MDYFNLIVATSLLKFQIKHNVVFAAKGEVVLTSCCRFACFFSSCQYSSVTSLDKNFCVFLTKKCPAGDSALALTREQFNILKYLNFFFQCGVQMDYQPHVLFQ